MAAMISEHRSTTTAPDEVQPAKGDTCHLRVITGPAAGTSLLLHGDDVTVGRAPEMRLRIDDPCMSRTHARFFKSGGVWLVEDQSSLNGVTIEGARLGGPRAIREGMRLGLGKNTLLDLRTSALEGASSLLFADLKAFADEARALVRSFTAIVVRLDRFGEVAFAGAKKEVDRLADLVHEHIARAAGDGHVGGRLGLDHFIVLTRLGTGESMRFAARLNHAVDCERFRLGGKTYALSASVAVVPVLPTAEVASQALCQRLQAAAFGATHQQPSSVVHVTGFGVDVEFR